MRAQSPRSLPLALGAALFVSCWLTAEVTASQNPFKFIFGRGDKFQVFKDPAGRFELEIPAKEWQYMSSGGSSIAVFTHKDGPALYIDYVKLVGPLTPGEFEVMPEMEIRWLKDRQPKAKDFKSEILETKFGRGVLIRYARVGAEPESIVHYSIPVVQDLFRLTGVVPDKLLSKFEPVVLHMIQTFKVPTDRPAPKN